MKLPIKMLPALALAVALSPLAAQAQAAHHSAHAQTYRHVDNVMVGSSTIDNPTHVYSTDVFPGSFGG